MMMRVLLKLHRIGFTELGYTGGKLARFLSRIDYRGGEKAKKKLEIKVFSFSLKNRGGKKSEVKVGLGQKLFVPPNLGNQKHFYAHPLLLPLLEKKKHRGKEKKSCLPSTSSTEKLLFFARFCALETAT